MNPNDLCTIISNLIILSMRYAFIVYFLKPKFKRSIIIPSFLAGITLTYIVSAYLPFLSAVRLIVGEGIFFIPVIICYQDSLLKKLLYCFLSFIAMLASESIITIVFFTSLNDVSNPTLCSVYIGILGLILGAIIIVAKITSKATAGYCTSHNYVAFTFLIASEGIMLLGWINYSFEVSSYLNAVEYILPIVISIVACVFADAFLLKTFRETSEFVKTDIENKALTSQVNAQKEYYSLISSEYTEIRHLRHDISNHLYTINALLEDGKTDQAVKYANDLKSDKFMYSYHICSNITADSFLMHKINALKGESIEVDTSALILPDSLYFTDVELITLFGNLLDNAAEACRHQCDKIIHMSSCVSHGFFTIATENKVPEIYAKKQHIDGIERGIGSTILEELAEKYDGHFSKSSAGGIFKSSFSVPYNNAII